MPVAVIDQTIREGMQYQGLVFSLEQRLKMMAFQERLGVDICQAGYPSAHPREAGMVKRMAAHARQKGWRIRVAALGRAFGPDADILLSTGINDFHFHLHIKNDGDISGLKTTFQTLKDLTECVRQSAPKAVISLAMLDMGRTRKDFLDACIRFSSGELNLDILSLPDTSGIMTPNRVEEKIRAATALAGDTLISVHCHNDMGMAGANTFAGVLAGAGAMEVSALGLGERNGIADLFTTALLLKGQGVDLNLDTDNRDLALEYYTYVNHIVKAQTGHSLLQPFTPLFGSACATHVAGTHANGQFGTAATGTFFLNPLCGRGLVARYLDANAIPYKKENLDRITSAVKTSSFAKGRRLVPAEVKAIVRNPQHPVPS